MIFHQGKKIHKSTNIFSLLKLLIVNKCECHQILILEHACESVTTKCVFKLLNINMFVSIPNLGTWN